MALRNPAMIRMLTIHRCLQNASLQNPWNWERLAKACGRKLRAEIDNHIPDPKERTIKGDLKAIREGALGAPLNIGFNRQWKSYYYVEEEDIKKIDLIREQDLTAIYRSLLLLKNFEGFGEVVALETLLNELSTKLSVTKPSLSPVVQFDTNPNATGLRWLDKVYDHILQQQCVQIIYKRFQDNTSFQRIVSPYLLKEYNKRWFLIGYDHGKEQVHTIPLDRIQQLDTHLLKNYYRAPQFHPDHYFKDCLGVTIYEGTQPKDVRIKSLPEQAKYIETKPIHHSQQILETTESYTIFGYHLYLNYELESHLLSFGEKIEVLHPIQLRKSIEARLQKMSAVYRMV